MESTFVFQGVFENVIYGKAMERLAMINWQTTDMMEALLFPEEWLFENLDEVVRDKLREFLLEQKFEKVIVECIDRKLVAWQVPLFSDSVLANRIRSVFAESYNAIVLRFEEEAKDIVENFVNGESLEGKYDASPVIMNFIEEEVANYNRMVIKYNARHRKKLPYIYIDNTPYEIHLSKAPFHLDDYANNHYMEEKKRFVSIFVNSVKLSALGAYPPSKFKVMVCLSCIRDVSRDLQEEGFIVSNIPLWPESYYNPDRVGEAYLYIEIPNFKEFVLQERMKNNFVV